MAKSANFARIKQDVLGLIEEIPRGRITTYGVIGRQLDVMARHVAYILAMLTEEEAKAVAWHRVVGDLGYLKSTKRRSATRQAALLESENVAVSEEDRVADFERLVYLFE